jgi:hypothetical protein
MRKILYRNKKPAPGTYTVYRETVKDDLDYIQDCLEKIVERDDVCRRCQEPELKEISQRLNQPNAQMPRRSAQHGGGRNSARSMADGVIENFKQGQYDISHRQMPGIEEAIRTASELFTDIEAVVFEEVDELPKKKPAAAAAPAPDTFNDLFEIEIVQPMIVRLKRI